MLPVPSPVAALPSAQDMLRMINQLQQQNFEQADKLRMAQEQAAAAELQVSQLSQQVHTQLSLPFHSLSLTVGELGDRVTGLESALPMPNIDDFEFMPVSPGAHAPTHTVPPTC